MFGDKMKISKNTVLEFSYFVGNDWIKLNGIDNLLSAVNIAETFYRSLTRPVKTLFVDCLLIEHDQPIGLLRYQYNQGTKAWSKIIS